LPETRDERPLWLKLSYTRYFGGPKSNLPKRKMEKNKLFLYEASIARCAFVTAALRSR